MKILYVNSKMKEHGNCGVWQQGVRISKILKNYAHIQYLECDDYASLINYYKQNLPDIIVYNFAEHHMSWLKVSQMHLDMPVKHINFGHEISQEIVSDPLKYGYSFFDAFVVADTTLLEINNFFPIVRPLSFGKPSSSTEPRDRIRIGSFGFPFPNKGFKEIIQAVNAEFEDADVYIHMPYAYHSLNSQSNPLSFKSMAEKNNKVYTNTQFLSDSALVCFLSMNDLNLFLYNDSERAYNPKLNGVSSVLDYAIVAEKPIGVSNSTQFRHVINLPHYPEVSLKEMINNGNSEVIKLKEAWDHKNFVNRFLDIMEKV